MDLKRLLNPKSIAIVGASDTPGKTGYIIFDLLRKSERVLYPVNPKKDSLFNFKAYKTIEELPEGIDMAVLATSARISVSATKSCVEKGIPFVIIVAAGFSEIGLEGAELERELRTIIQNTNTRILGPNSLGVFLPKEKIDTIFVEHGDQALSNGGGIATIVQSGSVGVEALGYASNTGIGMRAFVGLGNKSDLNETDFLRHFSNDRDTNCLAFYLENIEDGVEFLRLAKEASIKKPVVILKAGISASGASAVASHTGKLAGSGEVVGGAFKQFGIQRVYDDEELCDAAKVLSLSKPAQGNRVAVITPAGGYGIMCTDYIEREDNRARLQMAQISETTKTRIRRETFDFASVKNPIDITASADDRMFIASLDAMLDDPGVDIIICNAFFAPPGITDNLVPLISQRSEITTKPILVFTNYGPYTDLHLKRFFEAGIPGFPSVNRVIRAARFLVERTDILNRRAAQFIF